MGSERLDKLIASQTSFSRRDVKKLVHSGRVRVGETPAATADMKIFPGKDTVYIDLQPIGYRRKIYIMMNKPRDVLSVSSDAERQTAGDLVTGELYRKGIFPAGRLDKDSTGFLLLTDDGDFAHKILSPKSHVPKVYRVVMDALPKGEPEKAFKEGIVLADGTKCLPAEYRLLNDRPPTAEITLYEGMYHQVKRMLKTLGAGVCGLHRIKIGGLALDENLKSGQYREITAGELSQIIKN